MTYRQCIQLIVLFFGVITSVTGQYNLKQTIDSLPELSYFARFLSLSEVSPMLDSNSRVYTVFAPNDNAFKLLPSEVLQAFERPDKMVENANIMKYHIVRPEFPTSVMGNNADKDTEANNRPVIWFNNIVTHYYVNGAQLLNTISTSNGLIHIINRVMYPTGSTKYIQGFIEEPLQTIGYQFSKFYDLLLAVSADDALDIAADLNYDTCTLFLPENGAFTQIENATLQQLKSNTKQLKKVLEAHIIKDQIYPTTRLLLKENIPALFGNIRPRQQGDNLYVFNGMVSSKILFGNITVRNGMIHVVDKLLNFKTIFQQTQSEHEFNDLSIWISLADTNIRDTLHAVNNRLTFFAPIASAFTKLDSETRNGIISNPDILDAVLRLHIINDDEILVDRDVPTGNVQPITKTTLDGQLLKFYRTTNETYVEGGHVRARIVRSNVTMTNGIMHYIDTVLGVPYKTVQQEIRDNEWLGKMRFHLERTRLWDDLADTRKTRTVFAINNTAFEGLSLGEQVILAENYTEKLKLVLMRNIVDNEAIFFDEIVLLKKNYTSLNGILTVWKQGSKYTISHRNLQATITRSDIGCINGAVHVVQDLLFYAKDIQKPVFQKIKLEYEFSHLYMWITMADTFIADYLQTVNSTLTFFAPIANAFTQFDSETRNRVSSNPDRLNAVLRFHIVNGEAMLLNRDVPTGSVQPITKTTLGGRLLKFYRIANEMYVEGGHVRAKIIRSDVGVANGVMQYIDTVLGVPYRTVQEEIKCNKWLGLMRFHLQQTGLWNDLADTGKNRTVFAINDTAFDRLSFGDQVILTEDYTDKLKFVLMRNIVDQVAIFFDELIQLNNNYVSLNGILTVRKQGYEYKISHRNLQATVTRSDIGCTNGAVHIVQDLLFFPGSAGDIIGGANSNRPSCIPGSGGDITVIVTVYSIWIIN